MLVTLSNFDTVVSSIRKTKHRSLDTETTGLFPFHGDRLFSIIIGTAIDNYYFNWNEYPNLPKDLRLTNEHLLRLQGSLLEDDCVWFMHKAIYDLPILARGFLNVTGTVHCTKNMARVQYNEHNKYSLDACAFRIKEEKSSAVEEYIKKHKLYSHREINGKKIKVKRFDLVPFGIIVPYGIQDAAITYKLGMHQIEQIKQRSDRMPLGRNNLCTLYQNELRLEKTVHRMQMRGAKIDRDFCIRAVEHRQYMMDTSMEEFKKATGRTFMLSGKLFAHIFQDEKDKWVYTDKKNPRFDGTTLKLFKNPVAKCILDYKKAKAEIDFYRNFLLYADDNGVIHTDLNSGGTRTGRFSSSSPNLQNLKKDSAEAKLDEEFIVRRAIVPRLGYIFVLIDYRQLEYRLMLDYAGCKGLIQKVIDGLDVHTAMSELAGVTRDQAKTTNFLTLYGGGIPKLSADLGVPEIKAKAIQDSLFNAAPGLKDFMKNVKRTAEGRGFIINWLGRVCYFPKRNLCYKAPNTLIQGGGADIVKLAMVKCDSFLEKYKSRMILNIHDELIFEIAEDERYVVEELKNIMETVYPHKNLPLEVDIEWSNKSLADKEKWRALL